MTITLEQITTEKERLEKEIVERECVMAGLGVLQNFLQSRPGTTSVELGPLAAALAPARGTFALKKLSDAALTAPMALPALSTVPPYVHPELVAFQSDYHGRDTALVRWAIRHITEDYSLHDISALLMQEGSPLESPKISVVLTRLRSRGEIEEIKRSAGPKPAIFRKPSGVVCEEARKPEPANKALMADAFAAYNDSLSR